MRQDLHGKVGLVTGSAHRVGKAIALELARRGMNQIIHYHTAAAAAVETLAEVRALGVRVISFQADQADSAQIAALFAAVQAEFGRLDVLVNSAAGFDQADLLTLDLADWNRTLAVNLTGPFLCMQQAVRLMRIHDGGVIINISDESGWRGMARYPAHSVAKAGLLMLTEVAAKAFAPDVRVNAVIPGAVLRPPGYDDERWARAYRNVPLQRPGTGEDVARAVAFLAEEDYLTGTTLTVDGGESI